MIRVMFRTSKAINLILLMKIRTRTVGSGFLNSRGSIARRSTGFSLDLGADLRFELEYRAKLATATNSVKEDQAEESVTEDDEPSTVPPARPAQPTRPFTYRPNFPVTPEQDLISPLHLPRKEDGTGLESCEVPRFVARVLRGCKSDEYLCLCLGNALLLSVCLDGSRSERRCQVLLGEI